MLKPTPCDLAGLSVLVTRPAEPAAALSEAIQAARGRPMSFPAMEILGPADSKATRRRMQEINHCDLLIFISANAVQYAFGMLPDDIPLDLPIAAVGSATATALSNAGLDATLVPAKRMDSEGLLALPQLQSVKGKKILIIRGNGGRETLRETLLERGAKVDYIEVYRRRIPKRNPANLIRNWGQMVDVVSATSNAILDNLFTLFGEAGRTLLQQTPLVVISQRMAEHADELGCEYIFIADSALDKSIVKTLCEVNRDVT